MKKSKQVNVKDTDIKEISYPWVEFIIVMLYVLVEFVPQFEAADVMGSQWVYLSVLNIGVIAYLLYKKQFVLNSLFKNVAFLLFSGYILVSAISFFAAINVVESLVTYSRLIIAFIVFINLYSLLKGNVKLITNLLIILAAIAIVQSLMILGQFFELTATDMKLDLAILELKGNAGNKNFMATSLLLKLPFLLFLLHKKGMLINILGFGGLFVTILAFFIINSRSTMLGFGLEIFVYLCGLTYFYFKEKEKSMVWRFITIVAILTLSIVTSQTMFSNLKPANSENEYGGVAERIQTISFTEEGSNGRVVLWKGAADFISKNPMLGGGFGNWKIHSIPYENLGGFGAMKHAHNDYLEVTADTGVIGGLLYISFFILLAWAAFRIVTKLVVDKEVKIIALILLMSLVGYMVDSSFNFPKERPYLFIMMFFLAAAILGLYISIKKKEQMVVSNGKLQAIVLGSMLIFCLPLVYISIQVYKSQSVQTTLYNEWILASPIPADPPFKSEDINHRFPSIPNLSEVVMPIACMKAKYLCQEGKFDEALVLLEEGKKSNPYIKYDEFLRANICTMKNQPDSAVIHAKIAFTAKPYNNQLYKLYYKTAAANGDAKEVRNAFKTKTSLTETRYSKNLYIKYCLEHSQTMYLLTKDFKERLAILNHGIELLPKLEEGEKPSQEYIDLIFEKNFVLGKMNGDNKKTQESIKYYTKALSYKPNDYQANLNIGLQYVNLEDFEKAITHFNMTSSEDNITGAIEYFRGWSYLQLGKKDLACSDFNTSVQRGYENAKIMLSTYCK